MPSANRFALLRDTVRNHPLIVASSAASAGVLLGGYVAFQLLAPPHPRADVAAASPPVIAAKAEAKPAAETTGSAPANERTASADCDQETWPHLSPPCMELMRNKNRMRVVSTDRLEKPIATAVEAGPTAAPESQSAPATTSTAPVATSSSSPPVDLAAAPSAVFAAPDASAASGSALPSPRPTAQPESKKEKRVATKSKRAPKAEPKSPAKRESDDDDDTSSTRTSFASTDSDDRVSYGRADRRVDRRRIVERWTERDYDVPASIGDGTRRVTVIRRSGGGLFENLFGN